MQTWNLNYENNDDIDITKLNDINITRNRCYELKMNGILTLIHFFFLVINTIDHRVFIVYHILQFTSIYGS